MFVVLYRLILINYCYHPRLYVSPLFRLILINVFAGLFRLILYNVIGILWHGFNLLRLILNYKFVIFWHGFNLLQFCQYAYFQKQKKTIKQTKKRVYVYRSHIYFTVNKFVLPFVPILQYRRINVVSLQ